MNPLALIQMLTQMAPLLSGVSGIFPQLTTVLGGLIGGGGTPTASGQAVVLLQEGLNAMRASGLVQFDGQAGQTNSPLLVDGNFSGRTFAALKAAQAKFGFAVQEPLASVEMHLVAAVLSKL
jgi:hypothetical protein